MNRKIPVIAVILALLLPAFSYGFTKIYEYPEFDMYVFYNSALLPDDGGYLMTGCDSYGDWGYLLKVDADGDCVWTQAHENYAIRGAVKFTGGYMFIANFYPTSEPAFMRADATGNCVWTRTTADANTLAIAMAGTADNGFIMAGRGFGAAGEDQMYVEKLDASGNCVWARSYGTGQVPRQVINSGDGGYIICGNTDDYGLLMKIDSAGNTVWTKSTETWTTGFYYAWIMDVASTGDGYFLAGDSYNVPYYGYDGILAVKTDLDGNVVWEKGYDWGMSHATWASAYTEGNGDYGYMLAGTVAPEDSSPLRDVFVLQLDAQGNCRNVSAHTDSVYSLYYPRMVNAGSGNYIFSASAYYSSTDHYFYLKSGSLLPVVSAPVPGRQDEAGKSNYAFPQPASSLIKFVYPLDTPADVTIYIYNFANRLVGENSSSETADNNVTTAVDVTKLPAGVYSYQIIAKHADGKITRFTPQRFMVKK